MHMSVREHNNHTKHISIKGRITMKQVFFLITALAISGGLVNCSRSMSGPGKQLVSVSAVVLDSASGTPLDSVVVNFRDTLTLPSIAITDSSGAFGPSAFTLPVTLIFRKTGYEPRAVTVSVNTNTQEPMALTVLMAP